MTVFKDIGGSITSDSDGIMVERVFIVDGITGDAQSRLYQAMVADGIPQRGDAHPAIEGCFVTSVNAAPIDTSGAQARVTVTYGPPTTEEKEPAETPDAAVLTVAATTVETTTQRDKDGNPIYGTITFSDGTTPSVQQLLEASVLAPSLTLQFQRKETNNPIWKAIAYVGTVNEQSIGVFEARTLLCTELEGTTDDGGLTHNVSYVFQHNPASWAAVLEYQDKDSGGSHGDVNPATGNGVTVANLYPERDFSRLSLDFSFAKWPGLGF